MAFPKAQKVTPVDTNVAHILPVPAGGSSSGGGTVNPGSAAAPDHVHAAPAATRPTQLAPAQNGVRTPGAGQWGMLVGGNSGFNVRGLVELSTGEIALFDVSTDTGAAVAGALVYNPATDTWRQQAIANFGSGFQATWGSTGGQEPGGAFHDDGAGKLWVFSATAQGGGTWGYIDYVNWAWVAAGSTAGLTASYHLSMWWIGATAYLLMGPLATPNLWTYDTTQGAAGSWVHVTGMTNVPAFNTAQQAAVYYPPAGLVYVIEAATGNGGTNAHTYNPATKAWGSAGFANSPPASPNGAALHIGTMPSRIILRGNRAVVWYSNTLAGGQCGVVNLDTQAWLSMSNKANSEIAVSTGGGMDSLSAADLGNGSLLVAEFVDASAGDPSRNITLARFDYLTNTWSLYNGTTAISGDALIAGHVVATGKSRPAVAAGAALGTAPPAPTTTGNDARGTVGMGTGTATAAGDAAVVTFAAAFGAAPVVHLTPLNAATAALQPYVSATAAGSFTIGFGVAPGVSLAAGSLQLAFQVVG